MEREEIVYSLDADGVYSEDQVGEPNIELPKTNKVIYRIGPGGVYSGCMGEWERKSDTPGEWTYTAPPDQDMDSTQVPVWDGKDWALMDRKQDDEDQKSLDRQPVIDRRP